MAGEPSDTTATTSTTSAATDSARHAGAGTDTVGTGLARTMGLLARTLAGQPDLAHTLTGITTAVLAAVPGAEYAGITRVGGSNTVSAQAATDPIVDKLDTLQAELGQGPCIAALRQARTVSISDMSTEQRWPQFARRAAEMGVGSMFSVRLFVEGDNLGALNLYATQPETFTDDDATIAEVFAAHAAIALHDAADHHHLSQAVASRDMIGQAKGILMHRHHVTAVHAFDLLIAASQEANMKLTDVAHWLVNEHEQHVLTRPHNPVNSAKHAKAEHGNSPPGR